jgi:hypothetical protein
LPIGEIPLTKRENLDFHIGFISLPTNSERSRCLSERRFVKNGMENEKSI